MALSHFSQQKLLDCINDKTAFSKKFKEIKDLYGQSDMFAIHNSIEIVKDILLDQTARPPKKMHALRVLKEGFEVCDYAFLSLVQVEILPVLKSIAIYRKENKEDSRGKSYFIEAGFSDMPQPQLQSYGNSFLRLTLECLMAWSQIKPYLSIQNCQVDCVPSAFKQIFLQLKAEGVAFPSTYSYFAESQISSIKKRYEQKLSNYCATTENYIQYFNDILQKGLRSEGDFISRPMKTYLLLCQQGDSFLVPHLLRLLQSVFLNDAPGIAKILCLKILTDLFKTGQFEIIDFTSKLMNFITPIIDKINPDEPVHTRGQKLMQGDDAKRYGKMYYHGWLRLIKMLATAVQVDPFSNSEKDSSFLKAYERLKARRHNFPQISEKEMNAFVRELQTNMDRLQTKNELLTDLQSDGSKIDQSKSIKNKLHISSFKKQSSGIRQSFSNRFFTLKSLFQEIMSFEGRNRSKQEQRLLYACSYMRSFMDNFQDDIVKEEDFDKLCNEGYELLDECQEIVKINDQYMTSKTPYDQMLQNIKTTIKQYQKKYQDNDRHMGAPSLRSSRPQSPIQMVNSDKGSSYVSSHGNNSMLSQKQPCAQPSFFQKEAVRNSKAELTPPQSNVQSPKTSQVTLKAVFNQNQSQIENKTIQKPKFIIQEQPFVQSSVRPRLQESRVSIQPILTTPMRKDSLSVAEQTKVIVQPPEQPKPPRLAQQDFVKQSSVISKSPSVISVQQPITVNQKPKITPPIQVQKSTFKNPFKMMSPPEPNGNEDIRRMETYSLLQQHRRLVECQSKVLEQLKRTKKNSVNKAECEVAMMVSNAMQQSRQPHEYFSTFRSTYSKHEQKSVNKSKSVPKKQKLELVGKSRFLERSNKSQQCLLDSRVSLLKSEPLNIEYFNFDKKYRQYETLPLASESVIKEPQLRPLDQSYHEPTENMYKALNHIKSEKSPNFSSLFQTPASKNKMLNFQADSQSLSKTKGKDMPRDGSLPQLLAEYNDNHKKDVSLLESQYAKQIRNLESKVKMLERQAQERQILLYSQKQQINILKDSISNSPPISMAKQSYAFQLGMMKSSAINWQQENFTDGLPDVFMTEKPTSKLFDMRQYLLDLDTIVQHKNRASLLKNKDLLVKHPWIEIGAIVSKENGQVRLFIYLDTIHHIKNIRFDIDNPSKLPIKFENLPPTCMQPGKQQKIALVFNHIDSTNLLYKLPHIIITMSDLQGQIQRTHFIVPIGFNRFVEYSQPIAQTFLTEFKARMAKAIRSETVEFSKKIIKQPNDIKNYLTKTILLNPQNLQNFYDMPTRLKYGVNVRFQMVNAMLLITIQSDGRMYMEAVGTGSPTCQWQRVMESLMATLTVLFGRGLLSLPTSF